MIVEASLYFPHRLYSPRVNLTHCVEMVITVLVIVSGFMVDLIRPSEFSSRGDVALEKQVGAMAVAAQVQSYWSRRLSGRELLEPANPA